MVETNAKAALEARSNTVKQLCDLYRVVVAISVGIAFHGMIETKAVPLPIKIEQIPLFLAFVITVVPFFHGAVRHLFATYVESGHSSQVKHWALLVDFYLLFLGSGALVALAAVLDKTAPFLMIFGLVLALDCVWGVIAKLGFTGAETQTAEGNWALLNFGAVLLLGLLAIFHRHIGKEGLSNEELQWAILIIATGRTFLDYWANIQFYCPPLPKQTPPANPGGAD